MPKLEIQPGDTFNRLTIVSEASPKADQNGRFRRYFICQCACGKVKTIGLGPIHSGLSRYCGCLRQEIVGHQFTTHGQSYTSSYQRWLNMKNRCFNEKERDFENYGGRGISVYPEWVDSFPVFAAYIDTTLGERPQGCSLDRIDNNLGYEPGNLRWATATEQSRNRRPYKNQRVV